VGRKGWRGVAGTGVAGGVVPEAHGGVGRGVRGTAAALEGVGRHASPVPLLTTAVMGAMPIAAYGTEAQQASWLPGLADGSVLACAALAEDGARPDEPTTSARAGNGAFTLDGTKDLVAGGLDADVALVPARLDNGEVGMFLVPTGTEGLERLAVEVTTGRPEARFELSGVRVGAEALIGDAVCQRATHVLQCRSSAIW